MAFTSVNRLYFSSIQKSLDEDFSSLDKSFHAGVLRTHSHLAGIKCHICANQKTITHCHPEKLNSYVAKTLMRKLRKPRVPAPILRCLAGWSNFKRNLDKISWIFSENPRKRLSADFTSIYGHESVFQESVVSDETPPSHWKQIFIPVSSEIVSVEKILQSLDERQNHRGMHGVRKAETLKVCWEP